MTSDELQEKKLRFGEFTLNVARGALFRGGDEVHLRPQSFAVLKYLVENAGRLVSKDELFAAVWGSTVVTEGSLTQCLIDVRRALGDELHERVRTVPRRGFIFEMPVIGSVQSADAAPAASGLRATRRWLLATAAIAAVAVAVWLGATRLAGKATLGRVPSNTIAVLAFTDLSKGGDHQYFADGVAEEILNLLARAPGLRVVARTSSFSFRDSDADVAEIGAALDVAYLLEGSVRRAGERVRVTAQLVETSSGAHVWSENYDREVADLLAVQADIAERVAGALEVALADKARSSRRQSLNPVAYDHYLQAQFLHNRREPGDLALAEDHYRKALAIDPAFAAAWAGLAGTEFVRIFEEGADATAGLEAMRIAVGRALELDPSLPESQLRAAHYYAHSGDWSQAVIHHDRAEALGPNSALVLSAAASRAARYGRYEVGVTLTERAVALDPLGPVARSNYSNALANVGRFEDALREIRRVRELSPTRHQNAETEALLLALCDRYEEALAAAQALPDDASRDQVLALAYRGLGREAEAKAAFDRVASSNDPRWPLLLAELHAQWGEADEAFALLPAMRAAFDASARTPGSVGRVAYFVARPLLLPLRTDPRWQPLLAEAREKSPYPWDP